MDKEVKMHDLKQYKGMFDCLQEGIIVVEKEVQSVFSLFFANDIAQKIFKQVLQMESKRHSREPNDDAEEQFDYTEFNAKNKSHHYFETEIFYEYKNIKAKGDADQVLNETLGHLKSQDGLGRKKKGFSINDVLKMSQNKISSTVFTFCQSDNYSNLSVEFGKSFNVFKDVIKDSRNMQGISAQLIPEFLVFQIKKGETSDDSNRQTL